MPVARVLITGSTDGLGLMAGRSLVDGGHDVTLHARNDARAASACASLPEARHMVVGDLALAPVTQVWLATSDDPAAMVTGQYFYHQGPRATHPAAHDHAVQDKLLMSCAEITGVELP